MRATLLAVTLALPLTGPPAHAQGLRAGAYRLDVTPPVGYPMWGYAARRDLPSASVRDPLHARALVLSAGGKKMALVSLDLGRAPTRAISQSIRERVGRAGIDTIFLVASHTHHGPVLELDTWPRGRQPYVRWLEDRLVQLIVAADRNSRPATLGVAEKETTLNRNRHSRRADAPVDRQLLVLRVEDEAGRPIAHAVNFAAHPTILPAKLFRLSADYPGVLAARVEKATAAPCLFLQGASGDLSPNPRGERTIEAFGASLADEVLGLVRGLKCKALESLALVASDEEARFAPRVDLRNPLTRATLSLGFFPALIDFYEKEYREGVRPRVTTAVLDGRIGFVGVSGEVFCGHALHLKRRARLEHLFFLGYCNDYHQYFPTLEAASEGGYGTEPYIGTAAFGAGEQLMDRALIRLHQARGKLRTPAVYPEAAPAPARRERAP